MSPTRPTAVPPTSYAPVSTGSPDPNAMSPSQTYSSLSGAALPENAFLTPEQVDTSALLGGNNEYPAPSILSRNSSTPGTPPLGVDNRQSWGSNMTLSGGAAGIAGAENRPFMPRGQSNLAHSPLGWNNTPSDRPLSPDSDETDGQGHITPVGMAGGSALGLGAAELSEKQPRWAPKGPARGYDLPASTGQRNRKWLWLGIGAGVIVVAGLAIGLGVGLTRGKSTSLASGSEAGAAGSSASASKSASGTSTGTASAPSATSGGKGSLITLSDGTTMTYANPFGGTWVYDPANPMSNEAQANSWTPKLSQNWTWGQDKVYGVNIGGWLNTEPFIVPSIYEKYAIGPNNQTAVDEYTLSQNMGSNLTAAMTDHYETFITEKDFAEIASAGLNWVRIALPHWAIETWPGEPYLERVSWTYFLKAIEWCRKYGIRINLDFHTMPGSQNGWNHSGHLGDMNWLNGIMGTANAQRSLDYIRTLAQFIAQPQYASVIQMFGFVNEPNGNGLGQPPVGSFYYEAYNIIRSVTGIGAGNGPMLAIHDAFLGVNQWYGFLPGADRLALDQHSYMIFTNQPTGTLEELAKLPCSYWSAATDTMSETFGVNVAGEWSSASNDCGLWINNVNAGARYDGSLAGFTAVGSCTVWNDYTLWNETVIDMVRNFTAASMDSLQNYFYWTWKIGNSTAAIKQPNPMWHYRLGLQHGWIPADPRTAEGWCANIGVAGSNFSGTFSSAYMTGGAGAGTIPASMSSSYPWPPKSFTNVPSASMTLLPQYTQTRAPITMPALTFTAPGSSSTINVGNGWVGNDDGRQAYAAISGCSYPPEYSAATLAIPTSACGAGLVQPTKRAPVPMLAPTPPPSR